MRPPLWAGMLMPMRRCLALLAAGLTLAGCGGASRVGADPAKPVTVTLLTPVGDPLEASVYADAVRRLSHGALRVRVIVAPHRSSPAFEAKAIRAVQRARTLLAVAGTRAWDAFGAPRLTAFSAPLLIDSYALQDRAVRSAAARSMLADLRPLGLVGLGILPGPMRRPVGATHALTSPAAFRGTAIGEQASRVAAASLRALSARPVTLPEGARLAGLDGVELSMGGIDGQRLDVSGTHLAANVNLWPRPLVIFANARGFARLTAAQRRLLRAAAVTAATARARSWTGEDAEHAGNLCRRGHITLDVATMAQLAALRREVEPVYRDLERDPGTRAALRAIGAIKRQLGAPPSRLPACRRPATTATTGRTPLDGSWVMDSKRRDAGPDYLDENWGHWVFVFDRGRFAITQANRTACTWGAGRFSVDGDHTHWDFTGGGGDAPNGANNRPGESFEFRFSAFRDTLTLKPAAGEISPRNFRVHPWRRLGSPSRARLSRRCPPP